MRRRMIKESKMKKVYPIILEPAKEGGYIVYVPDFDINTQGNDTAEALEMGRDVIETMGCLMEDEGKEIPVPTKIESINTPHIKALIDVDFDAYRKSIDNKAVKKTLTLPSWLNVAAEKEGINFSSVLQNALKEKLTHK